MGRPGDSQDDWAPFAQELADRGYTALTYDRRPTGEVWRDVLGAADYLHDHGADTVIAAGASLGAMASLSAAERPDSNLNGVIWLAGILQNRGYHFRAADVSTIGCPMLFTSGDHDVYGAADAARRLHQWATAPSDLAIVHSQLHGTDIIADGGASARKLTRTMLTFIDHVAHQPTSTC
jgi:pimeloyl-ACP methyl ester carboxylesterase